MLNVLTFAFAVAFLAVSWISPLKESITSDSVRTEELGDIVTIDAVKFFCTWPPNSGDTKTNGNDGVVSQIVEMERWEYDYGEGGAVSPDNFDVVISLTNRQQLPRRIVARGVASFKVGQIAEYFGYRKDFAVNDFAVDDEKSEVSTELINHDFLRSAPWSKETEMIRQSAQINPGENLNLTVGQIKLAEFLKPYFQKGEGSWPFVLRVSIVLEDEYGNRITSKDRNLEIIPAD